MMANLDPSRLRNMNRYWQAANYLTIGQIYLQENPPAARAASAGTH
jgi:xylulose-5-phosphate/fructose-6-phosphate phosphoketolase